MEITSSVMIAVVYICSVSTTPDLSACNEHHHIAVYRGETCGMPPDCMLKAQQMYARTPYANLARHDLGIRPKFSSERAQ